MAKLSPAILVALTLACAPQPAPSRCEAMADHIVALTRASQEGRAAEIAAAVAEEHRAALIERCLGEGTREEVECVLETDSLAALQDCAPRR